ncbi:hypothetical protein [Streptomyces sp. NPDC059593]|uniref:hypothetical protein n=1 Tax=Streptomyces sp. NPDC059593 TaxID=3346878 RepID=UPI00369A5E62
MIYGHESVASGNWPIAFGPLFAAHIQCIRSRIRPRTNPPGNELHQVASTLAGFGQMTSKPQLNGVTGDSLGITGNTFQCPAGQPMGCGLAIDAHSFPSSLSRATSHGPKFFRRMAYWVNAAGLDVNSHEQLRR